MLNTRNQGIGLPTSATSDVFAEQITPPIHYKVRYVPREKKGVTKSQQTLLRENMFTSQIAKRNQ